MFDNVLPVLNPYLRVLFHTQIPHTNAKKISSKSNQIKKESEHKHKRIDLMDGADISIISLRGRRSLCANPTHIALGESLKIYCMLKFDTAAT